MLDGNWNVVAHFPEDALKKPHSGIADVALGDLEGNGKLKMYVGYLGTVGVQAVCRPKESDSGQPLHAPMSAAWPSAAR